MARCRSLASWLLAFVLMAGAADARGGRGGSRGRGGGGHGRSHAVSHGTGHAHGFGHGAGRPMGVMHGTYGRSRGTGAYTFGRSFVGGRDHWHGYAAGAHRHGGVRWPYGIRGPRYGRGVYGHGYHGLGRGSRYLWVPGAWCWQSDRYAWVPGAWMRPPASGVVWLPGHWVWRDAAWEWDDATWAPAPEEPARDEAPIDSNVDANGETNASEAPPETALAPAGALDGEGPPWDPPPMPASLSESVPPPPDLGASEGDEAGAR